MATRDTLHRLVDELPDDEIVAAEHLLSSLGRSRHEPLLKALLTASLDDEPTTPEEDAGAAEGRKQYRRGDLVSAEEAKRLLLS